MCVWVSKTCREDNQCWQGYLWPQKAGGGGQSDTNDFQGAEHKARKWQNLPQLQNVLKYFETILITKCLFRCFSKKWCCNPWKINNQVCEFSSRRFQISRKEKYPRVGCMGVWGAGSVVLLIGGEGWKKNWTANPHGPKNFYITGRGNTMCGREKNWWLINLKIQPPK